MARNNKNSAANKALISRTKHETMILMQNGSIIHEIESLSYLFDLLRKCQSHQWNIK